MPNSIHRRLTIAFIAVAVVPLLFVGGVLAWQSVDVQQEQALVGEHEVAQRVKVEVQAFIEGIEKQLRLTIQLEELLTLTYEKRSRTLSLLQSSLDVVEELALLDDSGQEVARFSRLGIVTQSDLASRKRAEEFVVPLNSGKTYYSPVRIDESTGEPFMTMAIPLIEVRQGHIEGVLVADIRLKPIWELMASIPVKKGESIYIVDSQQRVVAHRNPSLVLRRTTFELPEQEGWGTGVNGERVLLAIEHIEFGQQEFTIVAERLLWDAFASLLNALSVIGTVLFVAFLIASALGLMTVREIVLPIQRLAVAAQAIEGGDFAQRAQVTSQDELGILAQAFNAMAARLEGTLHGLQQRVIELEETKSHLSTAKKEAEAANQAKSDFLSSISHELRTPLNGILGYAQILHGRNNLSQADQNGLHIILQSGNHLLTLINDILDLSKIEARKMELHVRPLHMESFLDGIVGMIRLRAEEKQLSLIYELDEKLPSAVQTDEKRLRQILINLLGNAVKFTDRGQVRFRVQVHENENQTQTDTVRLRFEVIDSGIGIAKEQLAHIFLPFEQVGQAKWQTQGTGLGLSITHQLVQLMGTEIHVQSEVGQGSRFWFDLTLPRVTINTKKQNREESKQLIGYQGTPRQILIVDDRQENRTLVHDLLMPLDFELREAENGQQAVQMVRHHAPDLLLMDLVMPVMNGFEAVKVIREFDQNLPIIAISASAFEPEQQRSLKLGCDAFLPKPVDEEMLLALIRQHLDLEWMYEDVKYNEEDEGDEDKTTEHDRANAPELICPPAEELERVYELASLGRMSALRKQLSYIEQLDVKYVPFANQVRQLARGFEDDKIVALVEQYL